MAKRETENRVAERASKCSVRAILAGEMNTPTQADRLEFWKFSYARAAFVDAQVFAEELLASGAPLHSTMRKAFSIAIATAYSRPFKQRRAVRLPENTVPAEHRETHDSVIEIRDKIVAHRDVHGPNADDFAFFNQLRTTIRNGELVVNTFSPTMPDVKTEQILRLAQSMVKKMDYHMKKFVQKFLPSAISSEGTFALSLEENPSEWLTLAEK